MKAALALLGIVLAGTATSWAATPVRDVEGVDGKPVKQFAISTVAGVPAFTATEQTYLQGKLGGPTVTLTPTNFEIALSTTILDISPDQFRTLMTSKPDIVDKVLELEGQIVSIEHLTGPSRYPNLAATASPKVNKIKAQIGMLVGLYNSL